MKQRKWKTQARCAAVAMVIETLLRPGPAGAPLPPRNAVAAHHLTAELSR